MVRKSLFQLLLGTRRAYIVERLDSRVRVRKLGLGSRLRLALG